MDPARFENPSADKFGPPPGQERFRAPKPRRTLQWSALLGTLSLLVARIALDRIHATGTMEYAVFAAMAAVFLAEFFKGKRARDARENANAPTVHTITPR
jgi:hypothetical protein